MSVQKQIDNYIAGQPEAKRQELQTLHRTILERSPNCKLWFLDGKNSEGKVVSNPNIGYGLQAIKYAGGETKEFYRIGLSGNSTGISIYVMGLDDKRYLAEAYGNRLGKASVTGYCIKFRKLKDVNLKVIEELVAEQMGRESAHGS